MSDDDLSTGCDCLFTLIMLPIHIIGIILNLFAAVVAGIGVLISGAVAIVNIAIIGFIFLLVFTLF